MYVYMQTNVMHPQTFIILAEVNSVNPNEIYKGPASELKHVECQLPYTLS